MSDSGSFVDGDAAATDARQIRAMMKQAGRDVQASKIEALIDLIDERIQASRDKPTPRFSRRISLTAHNVYRRFRRAFGDDVSSQNVTEQQILDRENVILQLGNVIFGNGHGQLLGGDAKNPNPADPNAHRFSETPK